MRNPSQKVVLFALLICVGVLSACSRTEKMKAVEIGADRAYDSLGFLEVKARANRLSPNHALLSTVELATFGLLDVADRGTLYKNVLKNKLEGQAKAYHDAQAVINVTYWPDPDSSKFPSGYVYARGEMIRYRRFPAAT